MKSGLLHESNGQRIYALIFDIGDEVISELHKFAEDYSLAGSSFTAVGAFSDLVVGYFEWDKRDYKKISIEEQVEVLMLGGDIALDKGGPKIHAHVVVSKSDATAHGGHLLEAHVRPTLEMIVQESPTHLRRKFDEDANITVIGI